MNAKARALVVLNTITLLIMLFVNFAGSSGVLAETTVADISHKYDTLFAPAGYAFVIWGFLFLLAICFVIFQWILLTHNDPKNFINRTGIWFALSNIANASWIYLWIHQMLGWSVIVIFLLLVCLIILTIRLRLELDDEPVRTIFFVWWPVTFYLGWIMVATIACVAAWFVSFNPDPAGLTQATWTLVMIAIACVLYLGLIISRNMREAAMVGVWAFIAIVIRQWNTHFDIAITGIIASSVLAIASLVHVFKKRYYSIGAKLKRGEWK